MIMKGINDSKEQLLKFKEKIDLIKPNRIDINVPIRPPVEEWLYLRVSKFFPQNFLLERQISFFSHFVPPMV